MKESPLDDRELSLWALLGQTRLGMLKVRRRELRQLNISPSKSIVLLSLQVIGDKATPSQISRWLFREPHSISELISKMEQDGLVRKVKDLDRKDQVRVIPTDKGREVYYEALELKSIRKIMSCLSEDEHRQLRSCLLKLRDGAVDELGHRYKPPFPASDNQSRQLEDDESG